MEGDDVMVHFSREANFHYNIFAIESLTAKLVLVNYGVTM